MLTQERLKELLDYDIDTGVFIWRFATTSQIKAGHEAGTQHHKGYIRIQVQGKIYLAHRLAWLYVYGAWPSQQIDHINRIKADNRISNLREATNQEQQFNIDAKGYSWEASRKKWRAQITVGGKVIRLGRYLTEKEARSAYLAAKTQLHIL